MISQIVWRADAARAGVDRNGVSRLFEIGPDVGTARFVLAEDIVMAERITEEPEAIEAATSGLFAVAMDRETGHHRDIRIHGMADRHTLLFKGSVVIIEPLPGFRWIGKKES